MKNEKVNSNIYLDIVVNASLEKLFINKKMNK